MRWIRTTSAAETAVAKRLRPASKFFRFLWSIRDELFADGFEDELVAAYEPRGQAPCPPAQMAMAILLQRYEGASDADAVDLAENDRRWQLVLSCLGCEQAPFGQGSLVRFRVRMIANDLDKRLVARTVEIARKSGGFGWQKLRVALDSSPLAGAGRVEDTWNLIGRAMSKVVAMVSTAVDVDEATVRVDHQAIELIDGTRIITEPKSKAGRRTVAVPDVVVDALKVHLEQFTASDRDAWVFVGERGAPLRRITLQRAWTAAREATAMTHITLHDLRHAGAQLPEQ